MKKLMIAFAVAAMAIVANAAKVNWNSSVLYTPGVSGAFTTTEVADNSVTGYLVMLTSAEFTSFYTTYENDGYAKMAASVYSTYKDSLGDQISGKSLNGAVNLSDGVAYANGKTIYAALIYTTKDANGKDYYIANIGDYTAKTSIKTVYDFGSTEIGAGLSGTETALTGWTAVGVPEPTSGLMMLLGVGLMALRRRRA